MHLNKTVAQYIYMYVYVDNYKTEINTDLVQPYDSTRPGHQTSLALVAQRTHICRGQDTASRGALHKPPREVVVQLCTVTLFRGNIDNVYYSRFVERFQLFSFPDLHIITFLCRFVPNTKYEFRFVLEALVTAIGSAAESV